MALTCVRAARVEDGERRVFSGSRAPWRLGSSVVGVGRGRRARQASVMKNPKKGFDCLLNLTPYLVVLEYALEVGHTSRAEACTVRSLSRGVADARIFWWCDPITLQCPLHALCADCAPWRAP